MEFIDFCIKSCLHSWDKFTLVMVYHDLYRLLDLVCWSFYFFPLCWCDWLAISLSYAILIWFCYSGYTCLIQLVGGRIVSFWAYSSTILVTSDWNLANGMWNDLCYFQDWLIKISHAWSTIHLPPPPPPPPESCWLRSWMWWWCKIESCLTLKDWMAQSTLHPLEKHIRL